MKIPLLQAKSTLITIIFIDSRYCDWCRYYDNWGEISFFLRLEIPNWILNHQKFIYKEIYIKSVNWLAKIVAFFICIYLSIILRNTKIKQLKKLFCIKYDTLTWASTVWRSPLLKFNFDNNYLEINTVGQ